MTHAHSYPELPETVVHANRWHFFRHFLRNARPAFTPEETDPHVEAWSQPGAATGMINYYRSSVRTSPKRAEAALRPIKAPTLVIWGPTRSLPRPRTRRARPRRRSQPGPRRAPARRVALGPSRRGRARHTTAHRLFHPRPANQEPLNVDEVTRAQARSATRQAGFTGLASQVRLLLAGSWRGSRWDPGAVGYRPEGLCPSRLGGGVVVRAQPGPPGPR
jgi:hypothetical protein